MRHLFLISILLLCWGTGLVAQSPNPDSLFQVAEDLPYKYRDSSAVLLVRGLQIVPLSQKAPFLSRAGAITLKKGLFQRAADYLSQSRNLYLNAGQLRQAGEAYEAEAEVQSRMGNEDRSLQFLGKAQVLYDAIGYDRGLCSVLEEKGIALRKAGLNEEAMAAFTRALEVCPDSLTPALAMVNIAGLYYNQQEYDQALVYFLAAERQLEAIGSTRDLASLYGNIGECYQRQEQFEQAYPYLKKSLKAHRETRNRVGEANALEGLADWHHRQLAYDTALVLLEEARTLKSRLNYSEGVGNNQLLTGQVYFKMGKREEALTCFQQALQTFRKTDSKYGQMDAYLLMIGAYSGTGEYRTAFDYYQKYTSVKDSLLDEERGRRFRVLEARYENEKLSLLTAQQEQELELKMKELELQEKERDLLVKDKKLLSAKNRNLVQQEALVRQEKNILAQSNALLEKDKEILEKANALLESESKRLEAEAEISRLEAERQSEIAARRGVQILALVGGLALLGVVAGLLIRVGRQRKVAAHRLSELNNTKDKFFSLVAHDLKNPFGILQSTSALLAQEYDSLSDEHRKSIAQNLAGTISSSYELVDNLLLWSRAQSRRVKMNPVDLALFETVEDNLNAIEPMAGIKQVKLGNDVPPLAEVYADKNALEVILRNLVVNAVKFSHEGGAVSVSAKKQEGMWRIEVRDEGIGMSEEDQAKIFRKEEDPDSIGNHAEKGTGLGLLLCHEFAEQMGGRIWVESQLGKGTSFYFTVPMAEQRG